jgi:hypothetical protein
MNPIDIKGMNIRGHRREIDISYETKVIIWEITKFGWILMAL